QLEAEQRRLELLLQHGRAEARLEKAEAKLEKREEKLEKAEARLEAREEKLEKREEKLDKKGPPEVKGAGKKAQLPQ
ncbi:MAG TPA: hypothetical protein VIK91_26915, partial [Nannocystis sp.]